MLGVIVLVGVPRVLFLDLRGVREHDRAKVLCAGRAEDPAAESLGDEPGQVPAVIQVRVGQDDRIDGRRRYGKGLPVELAQRLEALKQPAINENLMSAEVQEVLRAGDSACGA